MAAQIAQAKIDLLNKNAANKAPDTQAFVSRRASAPGIILSDQTNDLRQRLKAIMDGKAAEEENANQIIDRMKSLRGDLQNTLSSCHKTLEVSSACLAEHFRAISTKKLTTEIKERFAHFDKDQSGSLDREEVREAMAEMGTRPTDEELEEFYVQCDLDGNGLIDLVEFEHMVRVKLGLLQATDLKESVSSTKAANARIARRASTSATQDQAILRAAAEAFGSSPLGPRARRASVSGAIESIPEVRVSCLTPKAPSPKHTSPITRAASSESASTRPPRPAAREQLATRRRSSITSPEPKSPTASSGAKASTPLGAARTRSATSPKAAASPKVGSAAGTPKSAAEPIVGHELVIDAVG